jgi:hypothetical protein
MRAPVGSQRGGARGLGAADEARGVEQARHAHLGHRLDDAGAADAGDAGVLRGLGEAGIGGPEVGADDLEARLLRVGSISTRSMAPGAARWPALICAPSKAGPVGEEQASTPSVSPSRISALVPTSTTSVRSVCAPGRLGQRDGGGVGPHMARDAGQEVDARGGRDPGRPRSRASSVTLSAVASAKGAWPSSTGSMPSRRWCITGLQTMTVSKTRPGSIPASSAISPWRGRRSPRARPASSPRRRRGSSWRSSPGSSGPRRSGSAGS